MVYHRAAMIGRYGTFTGGIDLPDEKRTTLSEPIRPADRPGRIRVSLAPCAGRAARTDVEPGRRVEEGERLASATDASAVNVHAPLAGRVEAIASAAVATRGGFALTPAVELADLSAPQIPPPAERAFDWADAEADELIARIADGGLTTYRRPVGPLAARLRRARAARCRTVIANVIEHEPYIAADHRLLAERGAEVVEGLALVARAVGAARAVLAADRRRTRSYEAADEAAGRFGVEQVALPHKYPIGADTILTKVLTRRETPPGAGTTAVGAAVLDAATCFAVHQWVVCGRPATGRVVTVAGPRIDRPANLWAPFGTPCAELAPAGEATLLHGGPMTGMLCDADAVVGPATCGLVALEPYVLPVPTACIRCGWCTDHCPARLNVSALNDAFELSLVDRARRAGVLACVECGVCTYVCPARLPLAQRVKKLKRSITSPAARPAAAAAEAGPS